MLIGVWYTHVEECKSSRQLGLEEWHLVTEWTAEASTGVYFSQRFRYYTYMYIPQTGGGGHPV